MTSASILTATGAAPIGVRRPPIPDALRPNVGQQPVEQPARVSRDAGVSGFSNQQSNLAGSSAVVVQISESNGSNTSRSANSEGSQLSEEEQEQVQELKERDREVRAHEQAHAAVGGPYASAPSYEFVRGPDGVQYAVAGQVQIDSAPIPGDPEATISKLETVQRAALAPAEPSGQDRAVAAEAAKGLVEARAELQVQRAEERSGEAEGADEQATPLEELQASLSGEETDDDTSELLPDIAAPEVTTPSSSGLVGNAAPSQQIINLFA